MVMSSLYRYIRALEGRLVTIQVHFELGSNDQDLIRITGSLFRSRYGIFPRSDGDLKTAKCHTGCEYLPNVCRDVLMAGKSS